jgi:hypothetical protein
MAIAMEGMMQAAMKDGHAMGAEGHGMATLGLQIITWLGMHGMTTLGLQGIRTLGLQATIRLGMHGATTLGLHGATVLKTTLGLSLS